MPSDVVAENCSLKEINLKMRQRRLQWFDHLERETRGCVKVDGGNRNSWKETGWKTKNMERNKTIWKR